MPLLERLRPPSASILHQLEIGHTLAEAVAIVSGYERYSTLSSQDIGAAAREAQSNLRLTRQAQQDARNLIGVGARGQVAYRKIFGVRMNCQVTDAAGNSHMTTVTVNTTGRYTGAQIIALAQSIAIGYDTLMGAAGMGPPVEAPCDIIAVVAGGFDAPTADISI